MELQVWMDPLWDGKEIEIKDGTMGTWLEMKHLKLCYNTS